MKRDYIELAARLATAATGDRAQRMRTFVDILWTALHETGVSWLGFYLYEACDAGSAGELVLGPMRDKPACSPIGLHGACGQAFNSRRPLVVHDVRALGPNYVACDPRDASEVVVPCLDPDGTCWGVLDLDSHTIGSFTDADAAGLAGALQAARLTA